MACENLASGGGLKPAFVLEVAAIAVGVALAVARMANAAPAENICVVCVEPDQRYRCEVTAGGAGQPAPGPADTGKIDAGKIDARSLPLLCAAKIAHDNGHSSCSVASSAKGCNGVVKVYALSDLTPITASSPSTTEAADDEPGLEEPGTVADMTKDTLNKSRENMRKAGEAMDAAAKRTLGCLGLGGGGC